VGKHYTLPNDIETLIKKGESQYIEFKGSLGLRKETGEAASAFSNTKGGTILIDISDSGKAIGIDVGKRTLEDLANYLKMNTDPPVYPEINLHNVGGKDIIEVKIKESEEKPVFFKTHAFKRVKWNGSVHRVP